MGLLTKALVFAAGYAVGHPEGRRRLQELTKQAKRNPKVKQAKERAWDVAGDQALAVKNRVAKRVDSASKDSAGKDLGSTQPQPHPRPADAGADVRPAGGAAPTVKPEDGPTVPVPASTTPTEKTATEKTATENAPTGTTASGASGFGAAGPGTTASEAASEKTPTVSTPTTPPSTRA